MHYYLIFTLCVFLLNETRSSACRCWEVTTEWRWRWRWRWLVGPGASANGDEFRRRASSPELHQLSMDSEWDHTPVGIFCVCMCVCMRSDGGRFHRAEWPAVGRLGLLVDFFAQLCLGYNTFGLSDESDACSQYRSLLCVKYLLILLHMHGRVDDSNPYAHLYRSLAVYREQARRSRHYQCRLWQCHVQFCPQDGVRNRAKDIGSCMSGSDRDPTTAGSLWRYMVL